jgi:hypothetical protein
MDNSKKKKNRINVFSILETAFDSPITTENLTYHSLKFIIEKNIRCLYVTMNNLRMAYIK